MNIISTSGGLTLLKFEKKYWKVKSFKLLI